MWDFLPIGLTIICMISPWHVRFFLLGAIEILPLGGFDGLGDFCQPTIPYAGAVAVGLALSISLCRLLRHQTLPTVIHAVPNATVE